MKKLDGFIGVTPNSEYELMTPKTEQNERQWNTKILEISNVPFLNDFTNKWQIVLWRNIQQCLTKQK